MKNEITNAIIACLGCPCRVIPSGTDSMAAYREAGVRGEKEGFIPVLVAAEDETLLECLEMNLKDSGRTAEEYRRELLSAPVEDGEAYFSSLLAGRKEEAEDDGFDWLEDVLGQRDGGEAMDGFYGTEEPLLLAEIPVKHPWEVFAYLPFGGWNECPDTPGLMAASRHWYEKYGAVPAVMTHDVLQFAVPAPVERSQAMPLALEQYAWCPDIVDQGCGTVGALADTLTKSTVWFFWWD